jgi:hypothetical protein
MAYDERQYVIFDITELNSIDFTQVLETSADTVRRSVDGTKTFVKWDGAVPACVQTLTTRGDYLTHDETVSLMSTAEWSVPMPEGM